MIVVMSLVYEDVYYLNGTSNSIIAVRSSEFTEVSDMNSLTKVNLTQLITGCLTISVQLPTTNLLQSHFISIL